MNQMLSLKHHEPYRIFIESTKNIAEIFKTMIVYIYSQLYCVYFLVNPLVNSATLHNQLTDKHSNSF